MTDPSQLSWISGEPIRHIGACLTFIADRQPDAIIRAFGTPADAARFGYLDELELHDPDEPVVAVRLAGSWTLAAEVNGWQGSRPEVLKRASLGTRAVSVFWNVTGRAELAYAVDGQVVATIDGTFPDRRFGDDPAALDAWAEGLFLGDEDDRDPVVVLLTLAARIAGQPLRPEELAGEYQIASLEPWPDDLADSVWLEGEALTYEDPPLAWALYGAPERCLDGVVQLAAQRAVEATGLAVDPTVVQAFAQPGTVSPELDKLGKSAEADGRRKKPRFQPGAYYAIEAVRELANSAARAAAFQAVTAARTAIQVAGVSVDDLRAEVLAVMGDPAAPCGSLGLTVTDSSPVGRYQWIAEHWLRFSACVTFVHSTDLAGVLDAYRADRNHAREAVPCLTAHPSLALHRDRDWIIAIEVGLVPRVHQEILTALPADKATSVRWEARGLARLWYIQDGRILVHLDPAAPDDPDGEQPHAIDHALRGLTLPAPGETGALAQVPTLLAVAEQLTDGATLPPQALDQLWLSAPYEPSSY